MLASVLNLFAHSRSADTLPCTLCWACALFAHQYNLKSVSIHMRDGLMQVQKAAASKLLDSGQIDGRMTATVTYPAPGRAQSSLAVGAVGQMEADLRHDGLWPATEFIAVGTK